MEEMSGNLSDRKKEIAIGVLILVLVLCTCLGTFEDLGYYRTAQKDDLIKDWGNLVGKCIHPGQCYRSGENWLICEGMLGLVAIKGNKITNIPWSKITKFEIIPDNKNSLRGELRIFIESIEKPYKYKLEDYSGIVRTIQAFTKKSL